MISFPVQINDKVTIKRPEQSNINEQTVSFLLSKYTEIRVHFQTIEILPDK